MWISLPSFSLNQGALAPKSNISFFLVCYCSFQIIDNIHVRVLCLRSVFCDLNILFINIQCPYVHFGFWLLVHSVPLHPLFCIRLGNVGGACGRNIQCSGLIVKPHVFLASPHVASLCFCLPNVNSFQGCVISISYSLDALPISGFK